MWLYSPTVPVPPALFAQSNVEIGGSPHPIGSAAAAAVDASLAMPQQHRCEPRPLCCRWAPEAGGLPSTRLLGCNEIN
jgi:hypothetical protein